MQTWRWEWKLDDLIKMFFMSQIMRSYFVKYKTSVIAFSFQICFFIWIMIMITFCFHKRDPGRERGLGGEQAVCLCALSFALIHTFLFGYGIPRAWRRLAQSSLDPVMLGWTPSGLKQSLQFQKILKLPINFIPWVKHAIVRHVFRPRSLVEDYIPLFKVGIGPEIHKININLAIDSQQEKIFFRISEPVSAECQKIQCG